MQRTSLWWVAGGLLVVLAACSENPNALKRVPSSGGLTITPTISLDQSVTQILSLYPKGLETAATTRWSNVKAKYAAGQTDPSQLVVAKEMLVELSDWLNKKTPEMATPPNNETRSAATARAVLYMAMYVYSGPNTTTPPYNPTADAVTGLVTPGAAATIVTPSLHAGVQLEAGSVAENTIIVVTQNPTPYPANCSGPLQTALCQYPQFYTFDQFPHVRLLKPAKFNVCHVNAGDLRRPLADHDRFRLAHAKPANPADYTPGSIIRDQNGESIEILPLVSQTFSTCENNPYVIEEIIGAAPTRILSRVARAFKEFVTPKDAYAIDVGLGGLSFDFSPFNDVDPLSLPDLSVESVNVPLPPVVEGTPSARPGSSVNFVYTVRNAGTASSPPTVAAVIFGSETPSVQTLSIFTIPSLPPGSTSSVSIPVALPWQAPSGSYSIALQIGRNTNFPDPDLSNNNRATSVRIAGTIPCSAEGTVRSTDGQTLSSIQFTNNSTESISVYWLDYNGGRVLYNVLGPQQSYVQGTYLTHPWLLIGQSGTCYGIFLPTAQPSSIAVP